MAEQNPPVRQLVAAAGVLVVVFLLLLKRQLSRRGAATLPPGPRNWPVVGALFSVIGALPHVAFFRLAKRHGPIMYLRMGTAPYVVVSNAHYAKLVLKEQDAEFASRPYMTAAKEVTNFAGLGVTPYGPQWRQRRRICNLHFYSSERYAATKAIRAEEVAETLREVQAACNAGAPVSMPDLLLTFTTNIICRMFLSKRYLGKNVALSRQTEIFRTAALRTVQLAGQVCVGDIIPALRPLDIGGMTKEFQQLRRVLDDWMDAVVAERETEARASPDFLDVLSSLKQEEVVSEETVRVITWETIMAAIDTSTTSMHWAFSELLRHPSAMARAQEELDRVVGKERLVEESDFPELPFLRAVVKETWRLHPPSPLAVPHHNEAEAMLDGYRIPAKSTVLINAYAIGRDPESWPNQPDEFVPERFFTPQHSAVEPGGHNFELLPFMSGRRKCPGAQYGYAIVHLGVAALLHAFDWSLPPGVQPQDVDMQEDFGIVLNRVSPCVAVPISSRVHPSVYCS